MRVQYRLTTDEAYYDVAYDRFRRQHPFRRYADIIKWIGLAVFGACLIAVTIRRVWLPVATLGTFVALIWFSPQIERFLRMRQLRRSPYLNQYAVLTFSDDGMEAQSTLSNSTGSWGNFTRATRFPDGWLLFMGPQLFRWMPDSALVSGATPLDVESLIRNHVDDVRHQR